MGDLRALLAGLTLALVLSASPSIANADDGDASDPSDVVTDDPGIAALHQAVDDMREARTALRTECPDMHDAKCRDAFKKVREAFKTAQKAAIEEHHAFKQEQKKARAEAKALKAKGRKASETMSPNPSPTPRG